MTQATFRVWRGGREGGELKDYTTDVTEGMVVLDAMHQIQDEFYDPVKKLFRILTGR